MASFWNRANEESFLVWVCNNGSNTYTNGAVTTPLTSLNKLR